MKKGKMPGNLMSTMLVRGFLYSFSCVFFLLIFRKKNWSKWYWFYLFSQLHKTFLHRRKKQNASSPKLELVPCLRNSKPSVLAQNTNKMAETPFRLRELEKISTKKLGKDCASRAESFCTSCRHNLCRVFYWTRI